jgi:hypothetical protein
VPDFTDDAGWHRQLDTLRGTLSADLQPIVLADSLDSLRTVASGFDGIAIYDPVYPPSRWLSDAATFSSVDKLFSFNVNPGFDRYPERPPFGECFSPSRFDPPIEATGWDAAARAEALSASRGRILESLRTTLTAQLDPALINATRGFFVTYINSFNEWHEGTAFEPTAPLADLSPAQRAIGYHNPENGRWRLQLLQEVLAELMRSTSPQLASVDAREMVRA